MREYIAEIIAMIMMVLTILMAVAGLIWCIHQMEWILYFIAYTFLTDIVLLIVESII